MEEIVGSKYIPLMAFGTLCLDSRDPFRPLLLSSAFRQELRHPPQQDAGNARGRAVPPLKARLLSRNGITLLQCGYIPNEMVSALW